MSDDLVKRLREGDEFEQSMMAERAADRIEELEAELATCEKYRDAYDKMGRIGTEAYRDLEAKLAKAKIIIDAYGDDQSYIPKRVVGIYREVFPDGTDDE